MPSSVSAFGTSEWGVCDGHNEEMELLKESHLIEVGQNVDSPTQ